MKRTLYQKLINGDKLTNKDVLEGRDLFIKASEVTCMLGPEFRIIHKEIMRAGYAFDDFARARKIGEYK